MKVGKKNHTTAFLGETIMRRISRNQKMQTTATRKGKGGFIHVVREKNMQTVQISRTNKLLCIFDSLH